MKTFTGNKLQYQKCREYLRDLGYNVSDATHIGDNRFEFIEDSNRGKGCHTIHGVLAWIDGEQVKIKIKECGFVCAD